LPSTKISTSSLLEGVEENARAGRENERGLVNVENLDLFVARYGGVRDYFLFWESSASIASMKTLSVASR
jgi:hypothetical protein